ncbi:MAG: hypothetical protein U0X73_13980 [Thermoanaerobaculia bacterium]
MAKNKSSPVVRRGPKREFAMTFKGRSVLLKKALRMPCRHAEFPAGTPISAGSAAEKSRKMKAMLFFEYGETG